MSDYLYNEKLLSTEDLESIYKVIDNEECIWKDGISSVTGDAPDEEKRIIKNSLQRDIPYYLKNELNDILFAKIDSCIEFYYFALAKTSGDPLVSRTGVGCYYKPHHDSPENGEFSTTVFLNEPDEYDGGELCLWVNGEVKKIKPPAGSTITYRTGTNHMVAEVTRGHRDAIVFWSHTLFKDRFLHHIYSELVRAKNLMDIDNPATLEEASKSPYFTIRNLIHSIERNHLQFDNES